MNVYYKIIELSKLLAELQNQGANTKLFISPELVIVLILIVVIVMGTSSTFAMQTFDNIMTIAIMSVFAIVIVPFVVSSYKTTYEDKNTQADNEFKKEAYKKQIMELYNTHKDLFDNKNLTNAEDIITEAKKKKDRLGSEKDHKKVIEGHR